MTKRYDVNGYNIGCGGVIVLFITLILFIIFEQALIFILGYAAGWLAKMTCGTILCTGFETTFGKSITPDMLPMIGGTLAWVGHFFKRGAKINTKKDK